MNDLPNNAEIDRATPDHIKRIIERIDPADREALERYLSDLIDSRDKAEHQAGILGDQLEVMTCRAGDIGDLADGLMSQLKPIGDRLINQDGRMTSDPLFCVFEKREVVADEAYDHDRIIWVDAELDNEEVTETKRQRLELLHNDCRDIDDRYQRLAIKEIDSFVTACLTEQGCKDFLAIQGHNLRKPFTYVTSLFRNEEMKALRTMMMGLAIQVELPPNPVNWNNEARRMASIMYPHMKKDLIND